MRSTINPTVVKRLLIGIVLLNLFFNSSVFAECPPGIFSFWDFDEQHIEYPTVLAINSGAGQYTDWMGNVLITDQYFSGGYVGSNTLPIGGTVDDQIYQSERYGDFSYAVPLPNGDYVAVLKFAETKWDRAGKRVFDVWMEGKKVIANLDIYEKVGKGWSYDVGLPVKVSDGILNIEFTSIIDSAQVSAIRILDLNGISRDPAEYSDSINNANATCQNNCPSFTEGIKNNAQEFDVKLNTGLSVPGGQFNWMRNGDFSVEFWVKKTLPCSGTTEEQEVVVGKYAVSSSWSIGLGCGATELGNGRLVLELHNSGGNAVKYWGKRSLIDGRWHHIVFLRDATGGKIGLYLDGQLEIEQTTGLFPNLDTASADLNIGWLNKGDGLHLTGSIDELAIYSKLLHEKEIKSHYYLARGYCETCTSPIKIMPLGDSITQGTSSGIPDLQAYNISYRKDLWEALRGTGYSVDFVGTLVAGQVYEEGGFDTQHEGHPGWTSSQISSQLLSWLNITNPEVILLHVGINDRSQDVQYVERILDVIDGYNENISVVLSKIVSVANDGHPLYPQFLLWASGFNDNLLNMAERRIARGDKIILVDQGSAAGLVYDIYPKGDFWDMLHPYASGYSKMANLWMNSLSSFLPLCGDQSPKITSVPVDQGEVNVVYSYNVNAFGNPKPRYELVTAPVGMTIDSVTGVIVWTPVQEGSVSVTVKADNTFGRDLQAFTIKISKTRYPLILSNSGGGSYTDGQGQAYGADQLFSGGNLGIVSSPIEGTVDDVMYQSERWGEFSYALPLANGDYTVVLKFAEIYWEAPGQRVFDVWMEGQKVVSSLDIFSKVGKNRAYDVVLPVSVTDGVLNIQFTKIVNFPKVSAIVVQ